MTEMYLNRLRKLYVTNSFVLLFVFVYNSSAQDKLDEQIKKLNEVISTSYKNHYNSNDASELVDAAIKGIIKELDPHSYYFTKEALREIDERRTGSYMGVGFEYILINDTVTVFSMLANSPSKQSNMQIGDKIIKVDGKPVVGMSSKNFDNLLRGERGSNISFDVKRSKSSGLINLKMKRTRIPLYSVDAAYILEGTDIGYVSINRFMATTYLEMVDSLSVLVEKGMKKLILDLRGNSGGLLDQAYMVADEFIPDGQDIVFIKGRRPEFNENYKSTPSGTYEKIPLIVLIDAKTASAPEIVAGAIQDLDRGLVIGETSFGKGLVQKPYKLIDGSELWLTIAQYYTPSGRCIQKTYKNNKNYGTLADRINLEEGLNVKHNLELVEFTSDSVPVYRTSKGRPVLGGGGITPDYILNNDSLSQFTKNIFDKNIISKLAVIYIINNKNISKGPITFDNYINSFKLDNDLVNELKTLAIAEKIEWDDNSFQQDVDSIKINLQATVAGILWSNNQRNLVLNKNSKYLKKALELFPVAENLLNNK